MNTKRRGRIYLVGSGPGDPDLLTVKALRLIQTADVIVHDRLVSDDILSLTKSGARLIDVGKRPDNHPVPQERIHELLLDLASGDHVVVRLKGGDPFVYGRGGEELLFLLKHGVVAEVVPGITSAQGCAASAGLPLTHRGVANGLRYLAGHCRANLDLDFDWYGLADPDTTLVVYMGLANMAEIARRLIEHGLPSNTPAMAVENGTRSSERRAVASLDRIAPTVDAEGFTGPVLFIIGNVVRFAALSEENALAQLDSVHVYRA